MATSPTPSDKFAKAEPAKERVENLTDQKLVLTLQNGHSLELDPYQSRVLPAGQEDNGILQKLLNKGLVKLNTPTT